MASMPRAVLVDLSGTMHVGSTLLDGAAPALALLRRHKILFKFVSNTTKTSSMRLHRQLVDLGLDLERDQIITPLVSAKLLCRDRGLRRPYLMLNVEAQEEFEGFGADLSSSTACAADYDSVVLGLAPSMFDYEHLNVAMRCIRQDNPLIALHRGRYFASGADELSLGPGAFVAALEYSTGVTAEVVGKPTPGFFKQAAADLGCEPGDCFMIGDDARDDVLGALREGGVRGAVLVKTGKYRDGDEEALRDVTDQFWAVADDVAQAVQLIVEHCNR